MQKKKYLIASIALFLLITSVGGGIFFLLFNNDPEEKNENNKTESSEFQEVEDKHKEDMTIDEVVSKLTSSGLQISDRNDDVYYQMIGAYDGVKVKINGIIVEIYQYKNSQKEAKINAIETLDDSDNTILENDSFLILIQSTDKELPESIKNALK